MIQVCYHNINSYSCVLCPYYIHSVNGIPQEYSANNLTELMELNQTITALSAYGGGDCPEYGMTGILSALDLVRKFSNVIVLTDASPKDKDRKMTVIKKAKDTKNFIHFFLSHDSCGDLTPYLEVADKTYGIVVNQIDDFEAMTKFINQHGFSPDSGNIETAGKKKKRGLYYCADYSTSLFTKSVDILFSSISSGTRITITPPAGSVDRIEARGTVTTYSKKDPPAGVYKICSTSTFRYSLSITSDLDFFVEYNISTSRTSLPTPGK